MTQEPRDIVLEHLRYIRGKLDQLADSMGALNSRTTAMERHMAGMYTSDVEQTAEIERLKHRVDRIERRLELTYPVT